MKAMPSVRIRDVATFLKGKTPSATVNMPGGGALPYILIESFGGVYKTYTSDPACVRCRPDDTIIVADGATGLASTNHDGYLGSTLAAVRPDPSKVNPRYMFYFIHSNFNTLNTRTRGATVPHLDKELLLDLEFVLPPVAEQERIVRILDETEALRRLRVHVGRRMADLIPALFDRVFSGLARRGSDWREARLEDLCSSIEDCPHSTPTYCEGKGTYPCVRSSDIQGGTFDWSTTKCVDESEYQARVRRSVPRPGDVVYCREGARLGNAAIIPDGVNVCLGQRMMLFRSAPDLATPEFIWALLHSRVIRQQVASLVGGSASPHLNVRDIRAFSVVVPPYDLQQDFTARVSEARALEVAQAASRQRLDDLFQSLLYRAFRGEL